jgi:hypothetical protein
MTRRKNIYLDNLSAANWRMKQVTYCFAIAKTKELTVLTQQSPVLIYLISSLGADIPGEL